MNRRNAPTRRAVLSTGLALGTLGSLSACNGGGGSSSTPNAASDTAGGGTGGVAMKPVRGFAARPVWTSAAIAALQGWSPMPGACATWFDNRAWMIAVKGDQYRLIAYDPATKRAALSDPLPSAPRQFRTPDVTSPIWPISSPQKALVIAGEDRGRDTLMCATLAGDTIQVDLMPALPSGYRQSTTARWIGDAIMVVNVNTSYEASGDPMDAANKAKPSYYLDAAAKKWVPLSPQHNGTVIGVSFKGGQVQPVELGKSQDKLTSTVWVGQNQFTSGVDTSSTAVSGSGRAPFDRLLWSQGGSLLFTLGDPNQEPKPYATYGPDRKPVVSAPGKNDAWKPTPGTCTILPDGRLYDTANGTVTPGFSTNENSPEWDLLNATLAPDGTLYANGKEQPSSPTFPAGGSYVSTSGKLQASAHNDSSAPVLVFPDGGGLFASSEAWMHLPKAWEQEIPLPLGHQPRQSDSLAPKDRK